MRRGPCTPTYVRYFLFVNFVVRSARDKEKITVTSNITYGLYKVHDYLLENRNWIENLIYECCVQLRNKALVNGQCDDPLRDVIIIYPVWFSRSKPSFVQKVTEKFGLLTWIGVKYEPGSSFDCGQESCSLHSRAEVVLYQTKIKRGTINKSLI